MPIDRDRLVVGRGRKADLPVTSINRPRVRVRASGRALPGAIRLGVDRTIPDQVDDDRLQRFEPRRDAIDFFESLEGMRVTLPNAVAIAPTNRHGEIWAVNDQHAANRTRSGAFNGQCSPATRAAISGQRC